MSMYATCTIEGKCTKVEVYDREKDNRLVCWGGVDMRSGKPFIVFTPPEKIPRYSVKQEEFFKTFLLAAHIEFAITGAVDYEPEKAYDCYKTVFPREHFPFGEPQKLPEFKVMG